MHSLSFVLADPSVHPTLVLPTWGQYLWSSGLSMLPVLLLLVVVWLAVAHVRLRSEVAELRRQVTAVRLDCGYLIEPGADPETPPVSGAIPAADVVVEGNEHPPRLAGI